MSENGSDSDGFVENGPVSKRVSTYGQVSRLPSLKEGYLQIKLESKFPFNKWKQMYFTLRPRMLYYQARESVAKHDSDTLYYEIDLMGAIIAESGNKNQSCCFELITSLERVELSGSSRKDMDEWITAIRAVASNEYYEERAFHLDVQGIHSWYIAHHARPTFCNVCHKMLDSVLNRGVSCEVCKFKAHKACASKAPNNCKWATLANVNKNVVEDGDGIWIKHQWLDGNLPVNKKCDVCQRSCGSVLKFQDSRCLWCRKTVHTECRDKINPKCDMGQYAKSTLPPTALSNINDDNGYWQAVPVNMCVNPLLVFVNSKSGDSKGVLFLRRFRRALNPAQVFDLMCTGPTVGLKLFEKLDTFRVLVCGGDGSIGWVLTEMDKLNLHRKAVVGVLPLGTGNDLSQVLGWGAVCNDDSTVPQIIERYENAQAKMLDRWSVLTYDGPQFFDRGGSSGSSSSDSYESHLSAMLATVLNSAKSSEVLDAADKLHKLSRDVQHRAPLSRFSKFNNKLAKFLEAVQAQLETPFDQGTLAQLTNRANSIKKAFRTALDDPDQVLLSTPRISPSLSKTKSNQRSSHPATYSYIPNDLFEEKYVMNNYFGLGVDAKIVLEFHKKRDASPKSSSRYKNLYQFGKLGAREIFSQTFRDLDKRIQLECDGKIIQLPSLQGIVIMNIPSYSGGINFWGNTDNHPVFVTPSFNDKMFEVMAVFGTTHLAVALATSPIISGWHRICQCHSVRITIHEGAEVPIQVDGEAWLQKPGVIKIEHKNRVQMLSRSRSGSSPLDDGIDLTREEVDIFWSCVEPVHEKLVRTNNDQVTGLTRHLAEFDRKRHDNNEILTRVDISQILAAMDGLCKELDHEQLPELHLADTINKINDSIVWTHTRHLPDDISKWTNNDVTVWLKSIGLRQSSLSVFIENEFKGVDLLGLDRHDLNCTINISKDDSAKIVSELKQLRKIQDARRRK